MKKIIALIGAIAISLSLCSCAPGECEACGAEGRTKRYTYQGESAYLCENCGAIIDLAKSLN